METNGYHGTNAILEYLVSAIKAMLTDLGLSTTWQVVRSNQPTIQAMQNNTVYVDIVSKRRYGTQGTKSIKTANGWVSASVWYEELIVDVAGFKQRDPQTDDENTLTSSDVIGYLQGCINANNDLGTAQTATNPYGVAKRTYFTEPWMQVIRSAELKELDYETDSGLKEKFPTFEFYLVIEQTLAKTEQAIDRIEADTHAI